MKKTVFAALVALTALCAVSCKDTEKCTCTIETEKATLKDQIVTRPEDKKCSEIEVSDVKIGGIISIDLSKAASISCKNYNE